MDQMDCMDCMDWPQLGVARSTRDLSSPTTPVPAASALGAAALLPIPFIIAARLLLSRPTRSLLPISAALAPLLLRSHGRGLTVAKALRFFPHDAAADETLERIERAVILRRDKADRVADGVGAAGAADAMDVVLGVHREIVIHDVRNAVHVDAARGDVGGHEHPHGAGLELRERAQPLVLRAVGMQRSRS